MKDAPARASKTYILLTLATDVPSACRSPGDTDAEPELASSLLDSWRDEVPGSDGCLDNVDALDGGLPSPATSALGRSEAAEGLGGSREA